MQCYVPNTPRVLNLHRLNMQNLNILNSHHMSKPTSINDKTWFLINISSYLVQSSSTILRYHLGTAAFGSLIIAVIKTVRAVLAYIQKQAKKSKNKIVEYLLCVLQCCMWCLENCAKFVNKNAYIQTSIYGTSFCKSSRRAFFLILRNILRVAAVNVVADLILILGKVRIYLIFVFPFLFLSVYMSHFTWELYVIWCINYQFLSADF